MAINRGAKPGRTLRIPLLCDPAYSARRSALLGSLGESARTDVLGRESLFAESLDPSNLTAPLDGVSYVVIRALSGAEFEAADNAVPPALAATPMAWVARQQVERIRRGLVWFDGDPEAAAPTSYPVEALAEQTGALWPEIRVELAARIETFSTLGESAGSSCAPSFAEPT